MSLIQAKITEEKSSLISLTRDPTLIIAFIIISVAALLRVVYPLSFPLPVNNDELSDIYDAFSLATTGRDRFQHWNPAVITGFGQADYHPSMITWILALPSSLFGLSVSAARVTCGILGTVSLIALFFTARKLFTDGLALTAIALAALSPWHLMFSRIAHAGAILPPLFAILIIYTFIIARDSGFASKLSAIAGFLCGLSTNAYQATRVTGSLFLIIILIAVASHRYCEFGYRRGLTSFMRTSVIIVLAFILGAAPQIATLITEPQIFFGRALNVTVGFEFSLKFFRTFLNGALANFGPDFLFLSAFEYNNLSIARLIPIEIIPFYLGLATITSLIKPSYRWFRPYLFYLRGLAD